MVRDVWDAGDAYEAYVGRWSRRVADVFVFWLAAAPALRWRCPFPAAGSRR